VFGDLQRVFVGQGGEVALGSKFIYNAQVLFDREAAAAQLAASAASRRAS